MPGRLPDTGSLSTRQPSARGRDVLAEAANRVQAGSAASRPYMSSHRWRPGRSRPVTSAQYGFTERARHGWAAEAHIAADLYQTGSWVPANSSVQNSAICHAMRRRMLPGTAGSRRWQRRARGDHPALALRTRCRSRRAARWRALVAGSTPDRRRRRSRRRGSGSRRTARRYCGRRPPGRSSRR